MENEYWHTAIFSTVFCVFGLVLGFFISTIVNQAELDRLEYRKGYIQGQIDAVREIKEMMVQKGLTK